MSSSSPPESSDKPSSDRIPAAQVLRMSTELQEYSNENQAAVLSEYADQHGFVIVRTIEDEGKSGLTVQGRASFKALIEDIQSGNADFQAILVLDVSRWGRFQDIDESAYYEYICKRAGIEVHYCAEQFENDGGPASTIIKNVKRVMAAEYSRELSTKVFQGQCRLVENGFRQGGSAGFGLRRMLIDQFGNEKAILKRGERKSLQTDRVVFVPGPEEEVRIVCWMYELFTTNGKTEAEIAEILNSRGILTDLGRSWTVGTVRGVLTREKYIGNNVYNRTSFKLKNKHVTNPPDMWVRCDGAFKAIVSPELFYMAQGIFVERCRRVSDEEMLALLQSLVKKHSTISASLIDATDEMPSSASYRHRFGSLIRAYQLAGYTPDRDYSFIEINRRLREMQPQLVEDLIGQLGTAGADATFDSKTGFLAINDEYTAVLALSRCRQTAAGSLRWLIKIDDLVPDITVVARMDETNAQPADYYLFPVMDVETPNLILCESNGLLLDTYRFDTLDYFAELAAREPIEVAA